MSPNPFVAMAASVPQGTKQPMMEMFINQLEMLEAHLTSVTLTATVYMALIQLERKRPLDVTCMEVPEGADVLDAAALAYAATRRTLDEAMETVFVVGAIPDTPLYDIANSPQFEMAMHCLHAECRLDDTQSDAVSNRVTLEEATMDAYMELGTFLQGKVAQMKEELANQTP